MRTKEIRKWIEEGGSLPEDLTQEEEVYLKGLGCVKAQGWHVNGQKSYEHHYLHGKPHGKQVGWSLNGQKDCEYNFLHGMKHGVFKEWYKEVEFCIDEEYFYGNKIK